MNWDLKFLKDSCFTKNIQTQVYFENICIIHQNSPTFYPFCINIVQKNMFYVNNEQIKNIDCEKENSYITVHLHTWK